MAIRLRYEEDNEFGSGFIPTMGDEVERKDGEPWKLPD